MANGQDPGRGVTAREQWVTAIGFEIAGWLATLGAQVPPVRYISGFPSAGRRSHNLAEAWLEPGGESFCIYVRPDANDPVAIASAIAQQLARIAAGGAEDESAKFRRLSVAMGLRARKTESPPGLVFRELTAAMLLAAGPLPEHRIGATPVLAVPKQSARLLRVACRECGYVARVARKWLVEVGAPLCPNHGAMAITWGAAPA